MSAPLSRGRLCIPKGAGYYGHQAIVSGAVNGDHVVYQIDFGAPDFTIEEQSGVEIICTAENVFYHGTAKALVGLGIPQTRCPDKRGSKSGNTGAGAREAVWRSRRQLDGTILYRVESPAAVRRRQAEWAEYMNLPRIGLVLGFTPKEQVVAAKPAHLRLVVDNTLH